MPGKYQQPYFSNPNNIELQWPSLKQQGQVKILGSIFGFKPNKKSYGTAFPLGQGCHSLHSIGYSIKRKFQRQSIVKVSAFQRVAVLISEDGKGQLLSCQSQVSSQIPTENVSNWSILKLGHLLIKVYLAICKRALILV